MELIDRDKIPYVQDVTYMKDFDFAYRYEIEAMPTVEAIPIEWIKEYIRTHPASTDIYFKWMIDEWEEEQEGQNEKNGS